jgi:hypothetical protein
MVFFTAEKGRQRQQRGLPALRVKGLPKNKSADGHDNADPMRAG